MSLDVIKQLNDKVAKAEQEAKAAKEEAAKRIEQLEKEFNEKIQSVEKEFEERKTQFREEAITVDVVEKAKKDAGTLYLKSVLTGRPVESFKEFKQIAGIIEKAIKPADIPDWLAEEFTNQIMTELTPELKVEALFQHIKFPEKRSQYSFPGLVDDTTAYLIAPGDDAVASAVKAAKVTFEAQRIKTLVGVTDQAEDEAVTVMADIVKKRLVTSLAKGSEKAIVLGEDKDDGYDSNDVRSAFKGLMKLARDAGQTVDNGGEAPTIQNINATRKLLGVYGSNVNDLAIITDFGTAYQLLELDQVLTVDKYGANATIVKGEIGKIWGISIIVSGYMSNGNDGRFTTAGEDKEDSSANHRAMLIVNKNYFGVADRGNVGIEVQRNAVSSTNLYVGFRDIDFHNIAVNAVPVAALVNID